MFVFDRGHFARQNDFRLQRIPDFSSLHGKQKLIREIDGKNVFHKKKGNARCFEVSRNNGCSRNRDCTALLTMVKDVNESVAGCYWSKRILGMDHGAR